MIKLLMEYCKECGDCCIDYCKSAEKICLNKNKPKICYSYPIVELSLNNYALSLCKGVIDKKIPANLLEEIVSRLNKGEKYFSIKTDELIFSID